ncbi:MAG: hypothetical protein U9R37_02395 [Campylobacterota bacterium]|nr:hypothetical protein [Campylobacterota bacterium]
MTIQLDKDQLYSVFNTDNFNNIESTINNMSPSMVEYYLSDLSSYTSEPIYLNRSNIQTTISIGEYFLFLDYNDDVYLEFIEKEDEYETASFW